MEKFVEKLALYDILVRLITGIIVLFAAEYFGVITIFDVTLKLSDLDAGILLLAGYFCGILLETIAMSLTNLRKKYEEKILKSKGCCVTQYTEQKKRLLNDGKQLVMDEPMAHIVMSLSLAIAFAFFLLVKVVKLFCPMEQFINSLCENGKDIFLLAFLGCLFGYRAKGYTKRRVEQICMYLSADSSDNLKSQNTVSTGAGK